MGSGKLLILGAAAVGAYLVLKRSKDSGANLADAQAAAYAAQTQGNAYLLANSPWNLVDVTGLAKDEKGALLAMQGFLDGWYGRKVQVSNTKESAEQFAKGFWKQSMAVFKATGNLVRPVVLAPGRAPGPGNIMQQVNALQRVKLVGPNYPVPDGYWIMPPLADFKNKAIDYNAPFYLDWGVAIYQDVNGNPSWDKGAHSVITQDDFVARVGNLATTAWGDGA